jgi:ATP-binding cassette, subfamily B, bacterial
MQASSTARERGPSVRSLVGPLVRAERGRLTLMSIAAILGGFAEAGMLVLIARIAFALASNNSQVSIHIGALPTITVSVTVLLVCAGGLAAVRMVLQLVQAVLAGRAQYLTVARVRKSLTRLYLRAGWPLQSTQREGRLQELLTTYTMAASGAVNAVAQTAIAGFNLAALLLTALVVNVIASIAVAFAALAIGLILRPLRAALRRRSARAAAANLEFATHVTELASTLQEIRIFGVEQPVGSRLGDAADRVTARTLRTAYVSGSIQALYQGIAMLLLIGALAVAYATGFSGLAELGAVVLIMLRSLTYAQAVQLSIQGLSENAPYIQTLREESDRYAAAGLPRGGDVIEHIGDLAFDHVWFEYEPGLPVLRDVSFAVGQGEIVGIVGPTGAGKSTLVQLLLRLREPTDGKVLADGRDVRELSLDAWYDLVTFVSQEPRLFAGTVAENIRFFRDDVDQAAIERAAKLAHIHDDVMSWPRNYDTPAGERGGQLSGGQRQRLCIARALVEDPDVVVLDEPTSALDVKSEALMRDTLSQLGHGKTVFVIAHRLSTLSICGRIMVILNGELQGLDAPERLEASNPFYREALRLSGMR